MDVKTTDIQTLFDAGTHFGYSRTRRHPSAEPFIFGTKDRSDIFDLEETSRRLLSAEEFAGTISKSGKQLLFVGGKNEAQAIVKEAAVREANQLGIPVIGLASSDCDFSLAQYPIPANDTSVRSIRLVAETIAKAYEKGKKAPQEKSEIRNPKSEKNQNQKE
ncbi:MAG TPA: uS2m family ribosomal protein [Candidatus Paceibacterota bacterium]|nr:uS2m family ribosomal protein [Candidatus Paceibacterota bacterium]